MYEYPYGNGQQLNLDWFLAEWKNLLAAWEAEKNGIEGALQAEIDRAEAALADVFAARDAAAQSAANALESKNAAAQSASDASGYLSTVQQNATAAQNAAQNAAQSESNAADSAQTALASKSAAAQSETAAGNSASAAAQSETAAGNSASAAAQSEANALQSKNAAAQSAADAAASKDAAAQSASDAAASAAEILTIQNPLMPDDFYGDDFTLVINGVTVTKKGNRINFKGTQTREIIIRPFSNDLLALNQYIKPPILNINNQATQAEYKPTKIVLETSLINNRQDSPSKLVFIYSNLNTIINGQDNSLIRQYLRANNTLTGDFTTWVMSSAIINENLINTGFAIDLFINCVTLDIDFDIIFNIRGANDAYLL